MWMLLTLRRLCEGGLPVVGSEFSQTLEQNGDTLHGNADFVFIQKSVVLNVISQGRVFEKFLKKDWALELLNVVLVGCDS